eukprot:Platyproteum_vivax@DN4238_c0_g1_i3.p1
MDDRLLSWGEIQKLIAKYASDAIPNSESFGRLVSDYDGFRHMPQGSSSTLSAKEVEFNWAPICLSLLDSCDNVQGKVAEMKALEEECQAALEQLKRSALEVAILEKKISGLNTLHQINRLLKALNAHHDDQADEISWLHNC